MERVGRELKVNRLEGEIIRDALLGVKSQSPVLGDEPVAKRNFYVAGPQHKHINCVQLMCERGLLSQLILKRSVQTHIYVVTKLGAEAVGLNLPAIYL